MVPKAIKENENEGTIHDGVVNFFQENKPEFNIRNTLVLTALATPKALKGIDES